MSKKTNFIGLYILFLLLTLVLGIEPYGAQAQTYVFSGKFSSSVTGDG